MYRYEDIKPQIFTESGQELFLSIRDNIHALLKSAGAVRMQEAICCGKTGDSWQMLACVDRMIELKEIREIPQECAGQHRVFVKAGQ